LSLTSLSFFCFFAITFGLYWLVRSNWAQKWLIIVASYVFYASFDYRFCLLLLATSLVGYVSGRLLEQTVRALRRKLILAAGLLVNLGVLAVFKYLG
jgi:D-alanyl-lipoteichoic acid acyltransferase DltB (MBOAT superfamily)